jgi:hypothetical protein
MLLPAEPVFCGCPDTTVAILSELVQNGGEDFRFQGKQVAFLAGALPFALELTILFISFFT